jgi:hypothetical protein
MTAGELDWELQKTLEENKFYTTLLNLCTAQKKQIVFRKIWF